MDKIFQEIYNIFIKPILAIIFSFFWIREVRGLENIPKKSPVIFASNHSSYFDFFALSFLGYLLRRKICFVAAEEVVKKPIFKFFVKYDKFIQAISFRRGEISIDYFKKAVDVLTKKDTSLVIFPEGTRTRTGKLQKGKPGVIKIALLAQTCVIPVGLKGTYKILPYYKHFPCIKKCSIVIGGPFCYKVEGRYNRKKFEELTSKLMFRIKTLVVQ